MPSYHRRHICITISIPRFNPSHRTPAHLNISPSKKTSTLYLIFLSCFKSKAYKSLESLLSPKNKAMEFRTLHLNSKPSTNGLGSTWNYVSTPTTLPPGETMPFENVPAFNNAEKILWIEAQRICDFDPAFQGWYGFFLPQSDLIAFEC